MQFDLRTVRPLALGGLVLATSLSLAACGGSNSGSGGASTSSTTSSTTSSASDTSSASATTSASDSSSATDTSSASASGGAGAGDAALSGVIQKLIADKVLDKQASATEMTGFEKNIDASKAAMVQGKFDPASCKDPAVKLISAFPKATASAGGAKASGYAVLLFAADQAQVENEVQVAKASYAACPAYTMVTGDIKQSMKATPIEGVTGADSQVAYNQTVNNSVTGSRTSSSTIARVGSTLVEVTSTGNPLSAQQMSTILRAVSADLKAAG